MAKRNEDSGDENGHWLLRTANLVLSVCAGSLWVTLASGSNMSHLVPRILVYGTKKSRRLREIERLASIIFTRTSLVPVCDFVQFSPDPLFVTQCFARCVTDRMRSVAWERGRSDFVQSVAKTVQWRSSCFGSLKTSQSVTFGNHLHEVNSNFHVNCSIRSP